MVDTHVGTWVTNVYDCPFDTHQHIIGIRLRYVLLASWPDIAKVTSLECSLVARLLVIRIVVIVARIGHDDPVEMSDLFSAVLVVAAVNSIHQLQPTTPHPYTL